MTDEDVRAQEQAALRNMTPEQRKRYLEWAQELREQREALGIKGPHRVKLAVWPV